MPRVDLFISNDRHHKAMTWPVAEALTGNGCRCRVLSLCELRGLTSPSGNGVPAGVEIQPVIPFRFRGPAAGRAVTSGAAGLGRRALRAASWPLLAPRLRALLKDRPDLIVLPNDAAFPYDRIARTLRRSGIPVLLLQEGIRFPLPAEPPEHAYGTGGAAAVAAWGEASAEYFRGVGVDPEKVHLTGSPRFDHWPPFTAEGRRRRARVEVDLPSHTLLLISNPIEDQGFCTHAEKMALMGRFLTQVEPLFSDPEFHLAIKLHGRESASEFKRWLGSSPPERVSIATGVPLWALLSVAGAGVVLASTVGLEALLCGLPLAVLEIPGHGFQYDYVQSGAAHGLSWSVPLAPQIESVFQPSEQRQAAIEAYLSRQLDTRHQATERVAELIRSLLPASR